MSNYYGRDYPPQAEGQYYGAPQQTYGAYENNYNTYQPPRDNSYRQDDMTVTRYDSEQARSNGNDRYNDRYEDDRAYGDRRRSSSRGRGYYDDRQVAGYDDRRYGSRDRSRSSRRGGDRGFSDSSTAFEEVRDRERGTDHHKGKEFGAGALGAAIGGFAGHELGHNKMATTIGVLAGAWGGYELEKHHEKKKERRESEKIVDYSSNDYNSRRGMSGSRSRSRRGSNYDDDDYQRRYDERRSDRWD